MPRAWREQRGPSNHTIIGFPFFGGGGGYLQYIFFRDHKGMQPTRTLTGLCDSWTPFLTLSQADWEVHRGYLQGRVLEYLNMATAVGTLLPLPIISSLTARGLGPLLPKPETRNPTP